MNELIIISKYLLKYESTFYTNIWLGFHKHLVSNSFFIYLTTSLDIVSYVPIPDDEHICDGSSSHVLQMMTDVAGAINFTQSGTIYHSSVIISYSPRLTEC